MWLSDFMDTDYFGTHDLIMNSRLLRPFSDDVGAVWFSLVAILKNIMQHLKENCLFLISTNISVIRVISHSDYIF